MEVHFEPVLNQADCRNFLRNRALIERDKLVVPCNSLISL